MDQPECESINELPLDLIMQTKLDPQMTNSQLMLKISDKRPPLNTAKEEEKPLNRRAISVKRSNKNMMKLNHLNSKINSKIIISKPISPDRISDMSFERVYEIKNKALDESIIRTLENSLDQSTLSRAGEKNTILLSAMEGLHYDTQPFKRFIPRIKSPLTRRQSPVKIRKQNVLSKIGNYK